MSGPIIMAQYNATQPTLADGQYAPLQCDARGSLYTATGLLLAAKADPITTVTLSILEELKALKELLARRR